MSQDTQRGDDSEQGEDDELCIEATQAAFEDERESVPVLKHVGTAGSEVERFEVPPIAPGRQLIVPIGRTTVAEFVAATGKTAPPALTGPDQNLSLGLFKLVDQNRAKAKAQQFISRLHGALRVSALPEGLFRLEVMEFGGKSEKMRARVCRGPDYRFTLQQDTWTVLEHGDVLTFCPSISLNGQTTPYDVFSFEVELPCPPMDEERMLHLKFILPGMNLGQLIGKHGRVIQAIESKHPELGKVVIADRHNHYPGRFNERAVMISAPSQTVFMAAISDILQAANIDNVDGIHIVLPGDSVTKLFPSADSQHRVASHLQVKLTLLPVLTEAAHLGEQILVCSTWTSVSWADVMLRCARANNPYRPYKMPVISEDHGRKRDRPQPARPHDKPGRMKPASNYAKQHRDRAARRGRTSAHNKQLRAAYAQVRKVHQIGGDRAIGKKKKKKK